MATNITLETTTVDYEPAYPIDFSAGSNEKQNTAWPKIKLEVERIYRLINEANAFLNRCLKSIETAYNALAADVDGKVSSLSALVNNTLGALRGEMSALRDDLGARLSAAERKADAAGKPTGQYIGVGLDSGGSYTAPADGFFCFTRVEVNETRVYINGALIYTAIRGGSSGGGDSLDTVPLRKGSTIRVEGGIRQSFFCPIG